jgi:heme exporter protein CcmD
MSQFADGYALYVLAAYAATAVIIGALIWSSVVASRRARRELDGLERERQR